jgi:homoserine dehydrogenase
MKHYKLAFLGFGNVNRALATLLLKKQADIAAMEGVTFTVSGIATGSHGYAIDPAGIDLQRALALVESGETVETLSSLTGNITGTQGFIHACGADALFEATPVNYDDGQPAVDYTRAGLSAKMNVLSANKGPVVHAFQELTDLARSQGVKYYFESAVMDGAPVFSMFRETLPTAKVISFRGVLNSTTNLILSRMEDGDSFDEAVGYAQSIGIAETDPSGDVDGWDASIKVSALATVLMGIPTTPQTVDRTGIGGLTTEDIHQAKTEGLRWKLVCEAKWQGEELQCRVSPQKVGFDSPLYGVDGTTSIIQLETDVLGRLSLIEEDPGPHTTAYGLLADFLNAVR